MNPRHAPLVLCSLCFALAACPDEEPAAVEDDARNVEVARVAASDFVRTATVVGSLEGQRQVQVYTVLPERVVSMRVREGDLVEKGRVLAILAADLQDEQVKQAEASLAAVQTIRDALAVDVERTRQLVGKSAAPRTQLEALENQLRAQDAQVRQTELALQAASVQKKRAVVVAPITGRATNIAVREGDMATPQLPLMSIVEGSRVKAVFRLPERAFLEVREGMPITLGLLGDESVEVAATVTVRGTVIDPRSRTGLVEVEVENPDGRLVPGAAVRAQIEVERRPSVILVPSAAVLLSPTTDIDRQATAFVARDGVAVRRTVIIGANQGSQIEILRGLELGEWLVVKGQHLLRDGEKLKVTEAASDDEGAPPSPETLPGAAAPAPSPTPTATASEGAR